MYTLLITLYINTRIDIDTNTTRVVEMLVPVYGLSNHYPICFIYEAGMGKRNKHHESMLLKF